MLPGLRDYGEDSGGKGKIAKHTKNNEQTDQCFANTSKMK